MIRELTEVDWIWPKLEELASVKGLANCDVLKALNNSVRNSRLEFSPSHPTLVFLIGAISKFRWSGPSTIPTPLFPKSVPMPSAPIHRNGTLGPTHAVLN